MINFIKGLVQLTIFGIVVTGGVVIYFNQNGLPIDNSAPKRAGACAQVVMYSATWCGTCKRKRAEFKKAGISFREYFVNRDPVMNAKFEKMARVANMIIGYPTLQIRGKLVKNYSVKYLHQTYNLCKKY